MALTRKMLKAMDIDEEKIEQIIDAHTDVTDALKKERDKYKEDAEKLPDVQRQLDSAKEELGKKDSDPYKEKYEKEHKDFEAYKKNIEAKETNEKKAAAYKELLKKAGVSEKRLNAVIRLTDLSKVELDKDGNIKDSDKTVDAIKEEWSDYIVKTEEHGAGTETPPGGNGDSGRQLSRAAQIVAKRNEMLYGVKGEDK